MKTIDNKAFIEIQNIILEHDYRELSLLSRIMNNLYIKESAEMILENINKGKIIISTGFFEIIPKTIVRQFSNRSLLIVSPLLLIFRYILFPLLILFKKFQIKSHKSDKEIEREKSIELREDIQHFYEHADDSVEMEKEQQEMLSTVFEFSDKNASEVMTPRTKLSCISSTDNLEKALHYFIDSGHSKLPVYESDPDNIIGVVYLYDLYKIFEDFLYSHKTNKSVCFLCKEHHNQLAKKEKESRFALNIFIKDIEWFRL